jgi:hypothetical protein
MLLYTCVHFLLGISPATSGSRPRTEEFPDEPFTRKSPCETTWRHDIPARGAASASSNHRSNRNLTD